jgi:hypothetical protein
MGSEQRSYLTGSRFCELEGPHAARASSQAAMWCVNNWNASAIIFGTSSRLRFVTSSCPAPSTVSSSVRAPMSFNAATISWIEPNHPACRERTSQGFEGPGNLPFATRWVVAAGGAGTRAARADRRDLVQTRPASKPAALRKNDRPKTRVPKFVVAWKQLPLEVLAGHVPHCHVAVARAVAAGGKGGRSEGRSTRRRRTHPLAPPEEEIRSLPPRRASGQGNP